MSHIHFVPFTQWCLCSPKAAIDKGVPQQNFIYKSGGYNQWLSSSTLPIILTVEDPTSSNPVPSTVLSASTDLELNTTQPPWANVSAEY